MPWHTIDGILFSLLSLFFFKWDFSVLIFTVLASLVKQSFFIFGFIMTIIILHDLCKNRKIDKKDLYIFIHITTFLLFSQFQYGIIENFGYFFKQISNSSASSNFYESTIAVYFFTHKIAIIAFIFSFNLFHQN